MNKTSNKLEDLRIYQDMVSLMKYIYMITIKYPKSEKNSLVSDIKRCAFNALENIIYAQRVENQNDRLNYLLKVDSDLKTMQVMVRISYNLKYINYKNYGSWSRSIAKVNNGVNAWERKICAILNNENNKNEV